MNDPIATPPRRHVLKLAAAGVAFTGLHAAPANAAVAGPSAKLKTGVTLHYRIDGRGTPIVFVPGWTCSTEFFQKQAAGLKAAHRVIRIDPRSQGLSQHTTEGNNFRQRGRDLAAFIDALGLDRVVLVGWSYGSYDVWAYLAEFGFAKVRGLVVLDQPPKSPFDPADTTAWGEVALTADPKNASAIGGFMRGIVDDRKGFWTSYAKYMLGKDMEKTPDTEPEVARIVGWGLRTPQSVATQMFADGSVADFTATAEAADAKLPTLYFARDDWGDAPVTWLAAHAPKARLVRIPTHMGFWVAPDAFNAALADFVAALPA